MASALRTSGPDGATRTGTSRSPDVRDASRRFDEALVAARRERRCALGSSGGPPRLRAERHRGAGAPGDRAWTARAHRAAAAPSPPVLPGAFTSNAADDAAARASAVLRAAVRALPPVIQAARLQEGARLALTLGGGALDVDLRGGAAGVEVTVRPAAALSRIAAAELPALVAALRARGVRVARAGLAPAAGRPPVPPGSQAR